MALLQLWQSVILWSAPYRARLRAAKRVFDDWWEVRTERSAPALLAQHACPTMKVLRTRLAQSGQR